MPLVPFDPLTSVAPLIVYIDYKSPYAYLAKDPTYAIEDQLGIEIDWRPFTLDIPSYLGSARLDEQGRVVESQRTAGQWSTVKYGYRDVRRYGSLRSLVVRGTTKIWDSSLAAIGMLWAKEQSKAVLRTYSGLVYERFWKRELDIEDVAVIEGVLDQAGARTAGFQAYASGEGRALHDHIQRAAFDAGIFGVPTYVAGGEVFFGREHLPRVRWLLTGGRGVPRLRGAQHARGLQVLRELRQPAAGCGGLSACDECDQAAAGERGGRAGPAGGMWSARCRGHAPAQQPDDARAGDRAPAPEHTAAGPEPMGRGERGPAARRLRPGPWRRRARPWPPTPGAWFAGTPS